MGFRLESWSANTCIGVVFSPSLLVWSDKVQNYYKAWKELVERACWTTSLTWKYVPFRGKLPLIAVRHGICLWSFIYWLACDVFKVLLLQTIVLIVCIKSIFLLKVFPWQSGILLPGYCCKRNMSSHHTVFHALGNCTFVEAVEWSLRFRLVLAFKHLGKSIRISLKHLCPHFTKKCIIFCCLKR